MSRASFFRGLPVIFACQFKTTDTVPVNIDITNYTQLSIYARNGTRDAIPMVIQIVDPVQGTFTSVITSTSDLTLGEYLIQADYIDELSVNQVSTIGTFKLVKSVRYG
jgi:hypothetical protein